MLDLVIGIVTYCNSNIIKETLESIENNTKGILYKVVIYDNNSTDNTIDFIKSTDYKNIEIIASESNHGFGYGHNRIIDKYQAKYYLIYNPDLRLKNNILKDLFDYMEFNKNVGMVTPKIVYPNGEIQYLCKENPTVADLFLRRFLPFELKKHLQKRSDKYEMKHTGYNKIFQIPYATGCFMFFRSNIIKNIGGFDEGFFMYLEDADITRRANEIAPCIFYPHNTVEHLWARGSHKSLKLTWINIKSVIYYFNKWGWKFW